MSEIVSTILESWPALKDDLESFLSDTDAWIITELQKACQAGDWGSVRKIIEVMEMVHNMNHGH
jgi:hypothetical protein